MKLVSAPSEHQMATLSEDDLTFLLDNQSQDLPEPRTSIAVGSNLHMKLIKHAENLADPKESRAKRYAL